MCCSSSIKHLSQQERSQDALAVQPSPLKMPLAAESYYAAVGSFCLCPAHALQAILHHRKEAGKCVLCRHVSSKASSPKILLRRGRNFCLCPAHALQAIPHHRKEAGKRVLCSEAPEEAACGRILSRRGRNLLGRPSLPQPLSKFASPPLLEQGASRLLDEALGFGLQSRCFSEMYPPSRGCLRLSFCLGSCRAFKGQSKKRTPFTGCSGLPLPRAPSQKDRDGLS